MDARVIGMLAPLLIGHRHVTMHLLAWRIGARRELQAVDDPWDDEPPETQLESVE